MGLAAEVVPLEDRTDVVSRVRKRHQHHLPAEREGIGVVLRVLMARVCVDIL